MDFLFMSFAFVNLDTTELDYDYFGYTDRTGKILIIRYNKGATEATYSLSTGIYATVWGNRKTLDYKLPSALKII